MLDTYDLAFAAGGAGGAIVTVVLVTAGVPTSSVLYGTLSFALLVALAGGWRLWRREMALRCRLRALLGDLPLFRRPPRTPTR